MTGGGPMVITGPMVLCARSDLSPGRFYSGRLANLALYNASVSAAAMAALYDQASNATPPQIMHMKPNKTAQLGSCTSIVAGRHAFGDPSPRM